MCAISYFQLFQRLDLSSKMHFCLRVSLLLVYLLLFQDVVTSEVASEDVEKAKRNSNVVRDPITGTISWSEGPDTLKYCNDVKNTHKIQPGKSFGTLPFTDHATYLRAKCHRYFCEPNAMAGLGKFDCIPLKTTKPTLS